MTVSLREIAQHAAPTPKQLEAMTRLRQAAVVYGMALVELLPDGPDKTWVIRNHRTTAMWANVAGERER